MIRIWAKIIKGGKIVRQTVYEKEGKIAWSEMHEYLVEISYALDIPTPILIKPHLMNFAKFNHVKFLKSDFVEKIDFDQLFLENISNA